MCIFETTEFSVREGFEYFLGHYIGHCVVSECCCNLSLDFFRLVQLQSEMLSAYGCLAFPNVRSDLSSNDIVFKLESVS